MMSQLVLNTMMKICISINTAIVVIIINTHLLEIYANVVMKYHEVQISDVISARKIKHITLIATLDLTRCRQCACAHFRLEKYCET